MFPVLGDGLPEFGDFLVEFCVGGGRAGCGPGVDFVFEVDDVLLCFFELFLEFPLPDLIDPDLFFEVGGLGLKATVGTDLNFILTYFSLQSLDLFAVDVDSVLV